MQSHFSKQLKLIRKEKGMSMQELADKAKVSKSMISKIERNEVQPALEVTLRIATALNQTLSEMLHPTSNASVVVQHEKDRPVWVETQSNIQRTMMTPPFQKAGLEVLHFVMPAGSTTHILPPMKKGCEKSIVMLKGKLEVVIESDVHEIHKGDSIYFEGDVSREFRNPGKAPCEYYMIIKYH